MRPPLRPAHHPLPLKTDHGVQRYLSSVGGVAQDVEPEEQTGRKEARHQSKSSTSRLLGTRSCTRFPVVSQLPRYCWYLLIWPNPTVRLDYQVQGPVVQVRAECPQNTKITANQPTECHPRSLSGSNASCMCLAALDL
jgi:hypothetical protein